MTPRELLDVWRIRDAHAEGLDVSLADVGLLLSYIRELERRPPLTEAEWLQERADCVEEGRKLGLKCIPLHAAIVHAQDVAEGVAEGVSFAAKLALNAAANARASLQSGVSQLVVKGSCDDE